MDVNEQIVRSWLEIQSYLVKSRIKYKITTEKSAGWGDIDLIAYRLHDGKRVAVDISAWMTEDISLSYVTKPDSNSYYRLFKSASKEARAALRKEFGVHSDKQYELWLVVSFLAKTRLWLCSALAMLPIVVFFYIEGVATSYPLFILKSTYSAISCLAFAGLIGVFIQRIKT